jgi:hypothetical protein
VGLAILSLGGIACLAGGWSGGPVQEDRGVAPAEIVAARFPLAALGSAEIAVAATIVGERKVALFDPSPILPAVPAPSAVSIPQPVPAPSAVSIPQPVAVAVRAQAAPPVVQPTLKPPAAHVQRAANRPGYVLNDAQIVSIKRRLNLTPEQERMWPAVEAALRNIAYAKPHGNARGGSPAARTQTASVDPDSPAVQGLKSAAFPLIMSFTAEQKSEVRSLVHVMGLEKLAAQF